MSTYREIKAAAAAIAVAALLLATSFTGAAIYRERLRLNRAGGIPPAAVAATVKGRGFFFQSCAHCHGQDADGGEDAPSLRKLQISGAHMTLVIRSGIKGEMPSFANKYNEEDTAAIVAYLKTLN
ncbi:MAG: c-type cytochrome [Verrucomicrobia bacterium]|nr:c-type cytochrome [Verrucomicrobiota bacterium]